MAYAQAAIARRTSIFISLLFFFFLSIGMSHAQTVTVDDFQARWFTDPAGNKLPYRLFVPAGYDPTQSYPLVLFLHGSGEAGTDNRNQLVGQKAPLVFVQPQNQARWPCFMVAPQAPGGSNDWVVKAGQPPTESMTVAMEIVDALQTEFSIDSTRLYVTGLSSGGYGTWDALTRYPGKFAAGIPICGGGDVSKAAGAAQTRIWTFHSSDDTTVSVNESLNMVAALRAAGGSPLFTEYDGYAHYAWVPAYSEPSLLPWLFDQTLPPDPMLSSSLTGPQTHAQTKYATITSKPRYQVPNPPGTVSGYWSVVSGPGSVSFGNATLLGTTAAVSTYGTYVLRLNLTDGVNTGGSNTTVTLLGSAPPSPVISAGNRTFIGSGTVSLSDSASWATIYYTLDGSTPTSFSTVYSGPFTLTSSANVKAIAQSSSTQASWPASAAITIQKSSTLSPVADAYVRSGTNANLNSGTGSLLTVERMTNDSTSPNNSCVYLKFDLTNLTLAPVSAALTLTVDASSSPANSIATVNLDSVADTTWTEKGITENNAPGLSLTNFSSLGNLLAVQSVPLVGGTQATFDVTAFVAANLGHFVTLQLIDPNLDQCTCSFRSREANSGRPALTVNY